MDDDKKSSNMVDDEHPGLKPKPPGLGAAIDHQNFNARWNALWQQESNKVQALDPFDRVDVARGNMVDTFNLKADELNHADARLHQIDQDLARAIEGYTRALDDGQTFQPELLSHINALTRAANIAERHYTNLYNQGQPLNKKVEDMDPFDHAEKQRMREQQSGRRQSQGLGE